ncbi:ferrous iron transport protein A [Vibrio albus]|uniref:Ferrous iron transport protein A n=1 Tax=Vibrio albus TaxID=2200953 RepID=A0A2U3BDS8_9VIBR|nr:FeoA domain-containing protein [Vibrio albus]PWI34923.1 ferrous iron transport protein A [Vibrio albus]
MKRSLLNLAPGQKGVISAHYSTDAVRQRLLDLGLIPEVEVKFVRAAPLGDPIQIKAGSTRVILRCSEAETVIIR